MYLTLANMLTSSLPLYGSMWIVTCEQRVHIRMKTLLCDVMKKNLFYSHFLTICVSCLPVKSQEMRKSIIYLFFCAPLRIKCVLKTCRAGILPCVISQRPSIPNTQIAVDGNRKDLKKCIMRDLETFKKANCSHINLLFSTLSLFCAIFFHIKGKCNTKGCWNHSHKP